MLELNFPIKPLEPAPAPDGLLEALGVQPVFIGKNVFDYLVEVESEQEVRQASPNMDLLKQVPARGVIVTSRSAQYDFVSRFFAPASWRGRRSGDRVGALLPGALLGR
jgi:predicted PhzF superfamily epimerase YddE/YHI9